MRDSAGIQQNGVSDGEDRDIRADAESERENRHDRKSGRLGKLPEGVTKLLHD
jgi:hypothetical protein